MFWNSNPATTVNYEVLLSKEDITLQEVMDINGVLEECRLHNQHLIKYLVKNDVLEKLVSLTIEEPTTNEDETNKYKYSNIACELLTCEVPPLTESLANNEALLRKLYSFLDADAPLNPLLASFFSKAFSVLITRNSEQNLYSYQFTCLKVLEFLRLKEDSISLLLKHLGTSAIMDLILKLVTKVEGSQLKDIVLDWLDEQKLIQRLVALLHPSIDSDRHYNAAQLLCDLINMLRVDKLEIYQQNKILETIESPEVVKLLLDKILEEPKCETSVVGGISVLLVLLGDKWYDGGRFGYGKNSEVYSDYLKVVESTTKAILPRLKEFHDILINPPVKPAVKTTETVLDPPLGNIRVEVAKLLSVLVASDNAEINKELAELGTINVLLDLFFKYTGNNFLHTQVQKCLVYAFNLYPNFEGDEIQKDGLVAHILSKCRIIQRVLDAWQENETQQTEHKRPRRGYMGHLIEIANNIFYLAQTHSFGALMKETVDNETLNKWENFVNTKLYEIRLIHMGLNEPTPDKDDTTGKNGSFGDFSQMFYSNYYQLQALAPVFSGGFGSSQENQFINDEEDTLKITANPNFEKINFEVPEEETDVEAVFFEKVCAQKFQTLDDYNEYVRNQGVRCDPNDNADREWQALENSSSDEEDEERTEKSKSFRKEDSQVEFNKLSTWPGEDDISAAPVEAMNPWESTVNAVASPDLGWANFESFPFVPNFGLNFTSDINTTIATSASYEIDTIPLDLTPSENNSSLPELLSKEEPQNENSQTTSNSLSSADSTDVESITEATKNVSLESKEQEQSSTTDVKDEETTKPDVEASLKTKNDHLKEGNQENCVAPAAGVGDVNSVENNKEEIELQGKFRCLSSQGLMTNSERGPEGDDSYQILKENVQAVPKETTQASKKIVSCSSEDKSANGPI